MGDHTTHPLHARTGTAVESTPVPAPPTPRKDIGTMHATHPSPADSRRLLDVDQVLDAAADYLDAHGWCQDYYLDVANPDIEGNPPACLAGALATVVYGPLTAVDLLGLGSPDWPLTEPTEQALLVRSATWWLARHLDPDAVTAGEPADRIVTDWNDRRHRTRAEVTATLRAAAAAYRDQEGQS